MSKVELYIRSSNGKTVDVRHNFENVPTSLGAVLSVDTQKHGIFCDTFVFIVQGNHAANCCTEADF